MAFVVRERIRLDYRGAPSTAKLLDNLSGVAADGSRLWTVSDEGRTLEVLTDNGRGDYRDVRQYALDQLIGDIPPAPDDDGSPGELDLEAITIRKGQLWIAGSHCMVRLKPPRDDKSQLQSVIRSRDSRFLLARFDIGADGYALSNPQRLPYVGAGSLRDQLKDDPYLRPFLGLPSKENGLDIEGMCLRKGSLLLGCRGPLLDSVAVVIELSFAADGFAIAGHQLHFLDLGGLSIRDMTRWGDEVLIIAGPVSDAPGPFKLYRWPATPPGKVQKLAAPLDVPAIKEKPEGICRLKRNGEDGLIVIYDSPAGRIEAERLRYTADWIAFR